MNQVEIVGILAAAITALTASLVALVKTFRTSNNGSNGKATDITKLVYQETAKVHERMNEQVKTCGDKFQEISHDSGKLEGQYGEIISTLTRLEKKVDAIKNPEGAD